MTNQSGIVSSRGKFRLRMFERRVSPSVVVGLSVLGFWLFSAAFHQWIAPYDPYAQDVLHALSPPSAAHWFGTDVLGRDVFSRILAGARPILLTAPLATLLGILLGSTIGLILGYLGGWLDAIASRLLEAFMVLPLVIISMLVLTVVGASDLTVILVIGVIYAPLVARTVRAAVRQQRERDYVQAARLSGAGRLAIMVTEILPNIRQVIVIELMVRLGYAFFTVATLSFLGLGLQPPSVDWGLAIAESYGFLTAGIWWILIFNAAAIVSLVVATNLIAEGIGAFEP